MRKHLAFLPKRMIMCNSFWGLEHSSFVKPNMHLTGSLAEHHYDKMVKKIKQTDRELYEWL